MAPKRPKRPRDPNQLGKLIVDLSVGEAAEAAAPPVDPATEFARQGGLKGGRARATALTPQRRREIARRGRCQHCAARRERLDGGLVSMDLPRRRRAGAGGPEFILIPLRRPSVPAKLPEGQK